MFDAFYHRRPSSSPKRKKRSPSPKPVKVHLGHLTRNVNRDHVMEIFSVYGTVKHIEMRSDPMHPQYSRGFAYVEYSTPEEAEKAVKHMDGGNYYDYTNLTSNISLLDSYFIFQKVIIKP